MPDEVRFKHDRAGVREAAVGPEMRAHLVSKAEEGKAFAIAIAPDAPPYGEGYISSFRIDADQFASFGGIKRAAVRLENTSRHALFVEYGTHQSQNLGHYVLNRTIDHIGSR